MSLLWIRREVKPFEKRAPLIPSHTAMLIEAGHKVVVESSENRIFQDQEYEQAGCEIVKNDTWSAAPRETIILGLKHLPQANFPLIHKHIYFSHMYNKTRIFNEKIDAISLMQRFRDGGGTHYDIEFLVDEKSQRIAAFGASAGLVGACIALLIWGKKTHGAQRPFKLPNYYQNVKTLLNNVASALHQAPRSTPNILLIGGKGRCGSGVTNVFAEFGLNYTQWGRQETTSVNKLLEILNYNILINCSYVQEKTLPFLTVDQLQHNRALSLIADISCETNNNNPLPIYNGVTSYENPTHQIIANGIMLDILAIDNLPTFLPYESSMEFSSQWIKYIKQLLDTGKGYVWDHAKEIFIKHLHNRIL